MCKTTTISAVFTGKVIEKGLECKIVDLIFNDRGENLWPE